MFVNNEIGVVQEIEAIGNICRENGVIFHVDAAQATGKVDIDLATLPVDLMSFLRIKPMALKALARCMCVVNHVFVLKHKCMVADMNVVCVLAH